MTTLHLQVQINDLAAFKAAFADHATTRRNAGVRSESVRHPEGDESTLVIDLDFDTGREAEAFLGFLRDNVWKNQPVLAGPPQAMILETVELV